MSGITNRKYELAKSRLIFEKIYADYNKRVYVPPDPLQFLYRYESSADREVVGLIASSLAYGRVALILKSVEKVLGVMGENPSEYLKSVERKELEAGLSDFVHRFTRAGDMVDFLCCLKEVLYRYGSVENLFLTHYKGDIWQAMTDFVRNFLCCRGGSSAFLLPDPSKGSACKRLALYLRWRVRSDEVDPGGWQGIGPENLLIPLDTHMFNICSRLGFCDRKNADGVSARGITDVFRLICPEDPVRYDFALTRFGIRSDMTLEELFLNWSN